MVISRVVRDACVRFKWYAFGAGLVCVMLVMGGCGDGPSIPDRAIGLVPDGWDEIAVIDVQGLLGGDAPPAFRDQLAGQWASQMDDIGVSLDDLSTVVVAVMRPGPDPLILSGNFDFERVRAELFDWGLDEEEYRGFELWEGGGLSWAASVAVLEDGGHLVVGTDEGGAPPRVLRGLSAGTGLTFHDEDSPVHDLMERAGDAWYVGITADESCGGVDVQDCETVAWTTDRGDGDDMIVRWTYVFTDEREAGSAVEYLEGRFDGIDRLTVSEVSQDGRHITVTGAIDQEDWEVAAFSWPANARVEAPAPAAAPAPQTARAAPQSPSPTATLRSAPVAAPAPAAPAPAPTSAPAATAVPLTAAPAPTSGPTPAMAPTATPPTTIPAAAPTAAPAVVPTPTSPPVAVAQPTAVPTAVVLPQFSGRLAIAIRSVGSLNGLPRACGKGCSDEIHLSGLTETLFSTGTTPDGTITTEPMLATGFTVDPSLEFATLSLRPGVKFHDGWGEMTARDVAYSFNDANSATIPDSIHEHGGAMSEVFYSIEAVDDHTVQVNYRGYDSRTPLRLFSSYLSTVGIMSRDVFVQLGAQAMHIGVGPFMLDVLTPSSRMRLVANPDYYGIDEGLGPFVESVTWIQAPDPSTRMAMAYTGEAQIAEIDPTYYGNIEAQGLRLKRGGLLSTTYDISWAGNYWESHSGLTGEALNRERDTGRPWIGDPFENGLTYDESTASMLRSQKVREAFSWAIDRQDLLHVSHLRGHGLVNHQPHLSVNSPEYREEWSWGTDFEKAAQLMANAGYPEGFEMDLRIGGDNLSQQIARVLSDDWYRALGVTLTVDMSDHTAYRLALADRATSAVGLSVCGGTDAPGFPHDWPRGHSLSNFSAGQPGAGQELPYATEVYSAMTGEPDRDRREELAARFYDENRRWANCTGILEVPVWPAYDPWLIVEWDLRPTAVHAMGGINNVRSVRMR